MDLGTNDFNSSTVSFGYQCLDQVYTVGTEVNSSSIFFLIIGADLLICIIFIFFYISESSAEKEEIKYFKCQQLSLNDFSLKIKGFTMSTYEQEIEHLIAKISRILGDDALDQIVQIKPPDRADFIEYQVKKEDAYKKLYDFMD